MKNLLISLFLLMGISHVSATETEYAPQANPEAIVTSGKARFTVLTPRMIRIQYSSSSQFEDRATFAVINRNLPVVANKLSVRFP
jgi:hypothetical protein